MLQPLIGLALTNHVTASSIKCVCVSEASFSSYVGVEATSVTRPESCASDSKDHITQKPRPVLSLMSRLKVRVVNFHFKVFVWDRMRCSVGLPALQPLFIRPSSRLCCFRGRDLHRCVSSAQLSPISRPAGGRARWSFPLEDFQSVQISPQINLMKALTFALTST